MEKSIFDNLRGFEVYPNEDKIFGIKSAIIFGINKNENSSSPLLYLTKPKNITDEQYKELISRIKITFK